MQPVYSELTEKLKARKENIEYYKKISGLEVLPTNQEYWCLCNIQKDDEKSEINQICNSGFMKKTQFCGVDNNQEIIDFNQKTHPEANWFCGDWSEKIVFAKNSGLVYLDATIETDSVTALHLVRDTLLVCTKAFVFANFIHKNPYSNKKCKDDIFENISDFVPDFHSNWNSKIERYVYTSSKTPMITFIFTPKKHNIIR